MKIGVYSAPALWFSDDIFCVIKSKKLSILRVGPELQLPRYCDRRRKVQTRKETPAAHEC
jgi:hypothetical protein